MWKSLLFPLDINDNQDNSDTGNDKKWNPKTPKSINIIKFILKHQLNQYVIGTGVGSDGKE